LDATITGNSKNEGFIVRIRKDKNKINICLGLPHDKLDIPEGYPLHKRERDSYSSNQWEFDISLDKPYDWPSALVLAVQVAEYKTLELGRKPGYTAFFDLASRSGALRSRHNSKRPKQVGSPALPILCSRSQVGHNPSAVVPITVKACHSPNKT